MALFEYIQHLNTAQTDMFTSFEHCPCLRLVSQVELKTSNNFASVQIDGTKVIHFLASQRDENGRDRRELTHELTKSSNVLLFMFGTPHGH